MFYRISDLRLANRNLVGLLRQNGGVITTKYFKIYFLVKESLAYLGEMTLPESLVCISINRKVGSAVERNRLKRLLRSAFGQVFKLNNVYVLVTFRNSVTLAPGVKCQKRPTLVTFKLLLEDLRYAFRCI